MRSKHSSSSGTRTRTQSREQNLQLRPGGTRYDYLSTSPPPVHPPSPVPSRASSPDPEGAAEQQAHALSLELFGANAKATEKRDWADDDVPSTLFSPGRLPLVLDVAGGSTPGRKDTVKQPHNASVFVGSLPPDMDEAEMAQHLAQHLSRFANVQSIKIVHDSKGGLCAFVQCENASQAAQLVSQAQTNPQPFMGRYLRYENARARRTLWISYRTPVYFLPCSSEDEKGGIITDENGVKGRWIESDLPDALRIWKPRDVRFPIVTYRGEARDIGDASRFDKDAGAAHIPPVFRQKGVLFTDLKFDAQTIKRMAEAFGPLESFRALINTDSGEDSLAYPSGHSSSRSPGMDTGIWEIKWEHRDDCITALNTLRRIPHLMVTWAKDSGQSQTPRSGFLRTPVSPGYPASYAARETISPVARGRPFLLLDCAPKNDTVFRSMELSSSSISAQSPTLVSPQNVPIKLSSTLVRRGNMFSRSAADGEETDDGWTVVRPQSGDCPISSASSERTPRMPEETRGKGTDWSEGDFPPLTTDQGRHGQVKKNDDSFSSPIISLNDPAPLGTNVEKERNEEPPGDDTPNLCRPGVLHRRSLSNPVSRIPLEIPQTSPNAQRLEIPPTPDLANSSLTQTPTSGQPELQSPMLPEMIPDTIVSDDQKQTMQDQDQGSESVPSEADQSSIASGGIGRSDHRRQTTVDPKTVFVGGLESYGPRPWDESRLREIFEKYGEVQKVHIVNPSPPFKKAGFAFVTFSHEHSAARAIREEHNRIYDRRQIRVQIRDMFPQRGGFKFRGRGFNRRPLGFGAHMDIAGRDTGDSGSTEQVPSAFVNGSKPFGQQSAYFNAQMERAAAQVNPHVPHQLVPSASMETDSATLRSMSSFGSKGELDASHESDSKTAVSVTPPPGVPNLSISASGFVAPTTPQGVPSGPFSYYPPHAWSSPCGVQMHYAVPYGAYAGMMPSVSVPITTPSQNADPTSVTSDSSVQWSSMYRSTMPSAHYPYMIVPPTGADASRSASITSSQPTTPLKTQPPLHATAFIQGDRGVLFPVYQPEALSNYMYGSSPTQNAAAMSSGSAFSGQQQTNVAAAQMWHNYPHGPQFVAYPIPPPPAVGIASSVAPPTSVQHHGAHQQMHGQPLQASGAHPSSCAAQATGHSISVPHATTATSRMTGTGVQSMPPVFFLGPHPSAAGISAAAPPRSGFHAGHTGHIVTPERLNTYTNKYPPRRDPALHHSRNAQHVHGRGPDLGAGRSPSAVRPTSKSTNMPSADQNRNTSFQHLPRGTSAATPSQLGFNTHKQEGGHSHQHQWMTNLQQ